MRSRKVIIGLTLLLALLALAIGYAAISNVTLNVSGNASASASDANFKVKFDSSVTPTVENATANITGDTSASIAVTGLTTKGDTATATYTVKNESTDLKAGLTANVKNNTNPTYFEVTYSFAKTEITAGESTTITVTVKLLKTLISDQTATIGIELTAEPKQGGTTSGGSTSEGGSSTGGTTPTTPTTGTITNDNIGDYIDLGNNIVGTEATTDDWRILYVDEDGTVYAILADYLPNSTGYATNAGLDTMGTYTVYSGDSDYHEGVSRDTLLTALTTSSNWSALANGIEGATVTGTPTADLLMNSYNTKNGTSLIYTDYPTLDNSTEDYDLYVVPYNSSYQESVACYLASPVPVKTSYVYGVLEDGSLAKLITYLDPAVSYAIRPVASLPAGASVSYSDGVWTAVK